jgi:hypothetical protein
MDYAFVPFHIIVGITKCGSNIIGSTIWIGTKNLYSLEQIERHGVGKPNGTTKLTDLSIYSY